MKKKTVAFLIAVLCFLLSSCGKSTLTDIPDYPDSVKLDIDYFASHLMPAPPWTSVDGSSYSGGPFKGYKIEKSEYVIVKDPSKPGLENFYSAKLSGWDQVTDEKGQDTLLGADYELYAWQNEDQVFLIYMLTAEDNVVLTEILSKGK